MVAHVRTILFSFGMSMWITLMMNLRVRCIVMYNNVWLGFWGQGRVARVGCRPCEGRFMKGYLRISGRVSIIGSTVTGTLGDRRGCGTGQGSIVRSTKIATVLLIVVFPDACSTNLCITVCLLLALPEWRLLFAAGCVSVSRAWAESLFFLMAPV